MSNKRVISKKLFDETNLPKDAITWHIWKRAFDLGYDAAINKVESSQHSISENDKPKGLNLKKLESKLDKALKRDYPDKKLHKGNCKNPIHDCK